jgi:hypothetical protein
MADQNRAAMGETIQLHGVTVGRVSVEMGGRRSGKTLRASLQFKPDHVGMMHAAARSLDKGEDR